MDKVSLVANKVGAPVNGRQNYELKDNNFKSTISVPVENADKFEKFISKTGELAAEADNEENIAKLNDIDKKFSKKITTGTLIGTGLGAIIPAVIAIAVKGAVWKRSVFGVLGSLAGAALGAFGSMYLAVKSGMNAITKNPLVAKATQFKEEFDSMDARLVSQEPVKTE